MSSLHHKLFLIPEGDSNRRVGGTEHDGDSIAGVLGEGEINKDDPGSGLSSYEPAIPRNPRMQSNPATFPARREPFSDSSATDQCIPAPGRAETAPLTGVSRKRGRNEGTEGAEERERKVRTCRKCGDGPFPGRASVERCKNPCRDCEKVDCRGRNSKMPQLTCFEGWLRHHDKKLKR